jgi:ATP-dependent DNA helicase DinG
MDNTLPHVEPVNTHWLEDPTLGLVRTVRPSQVKMANAVKETLGKDKAISFLEGATGVGKTYAYLVPSIEWAIKNKKRVVISTAQKNLQNQLFNKDLPTLINIMYEDSSITPYVMYTGDENLPLIRRPRYALLKGKNNYPCKFRVEAAHKKLAHDSDFIDFSFWLKNNPKLDLEAYTGNLPFISQINVEECVWNKCPHIAKCAYTYARDEALTADILVVNHSLLAIDMQLGVGEMLGFYQALIIDEGHKGPRSFRDAFTLKLTAGVLVKLAYLLEQIDQGDMPEYRTFSQVLNSYFENMQKIQRGTLNNVDMLETVAEYSKLLEAQVIKTLNKLKAFNSESPTMNLLITSAEELFSKLNKFFDAVLNPDEESNYIVVLEDEYVNSKPYLAIKVIPIDMGELIVPALHKIDHIIITSATLSTGGDFSYIINEYGLNKREVLIAKQYESSFNYKRNSLLYIPPDAIEYNHSERNISINWQAEEILKLLIASQGGAFILCASRNDLESFTKLIEPRCTSEGMIFFTQGRSVESDIQNFKQNPRSVLMGLQSIWEGVDVPGLALRLIIIPRLPFPAREDPLLAARKNRAVEIMVANGVGESQTGFRVFKTFDLPITALHLAQGAGRLIRSENDKGVVAVLDKRLYGQQKSYSEYLRNCLPQPQIGNRDVVLQFLGILGKKATGSNP